MGTLKVISVDSQMQGSQSLSETQGTPQSVLNKIDRITFVQLHGARVSTPCLPGRLCIILLSPNLTSIKTQICSCASPHVHLITCCSLTTMGPKARKSRVQSSVCFASVGCLNGTALHIHLAACCLAWLVVPGGLGLGWWR